jgi:hypothetical protein
MKFYSKIESKIKIILFLDILYSKICRVKLYIALIHSITRCIVICSVIVQIFIALGTGFLFIKLITKVRIIIWVRVPCYQNRYVLSCLPCEVKVLNDVLKIIRRNLNTNPVCLMSLR